MNFTIIYLHRHKSPFNIPNWLLQKVATVIICGLHGSKVGGKEIPPNFVVVKVRELFMPKIVVPNVDKTPRLVDPQSSHMKISPKATIP